MMTNQFATSRRGFLAGGLAGAIGMALADPTRGWAGAGASGAPRAKRCVLVWLEGGPSQIDTFDPKPGVETGGPFKAIETAAPGLRLSEHFPKLAAKAGRIAVIRSLTSPEADHDRATRFVRSGNVPQDSVEYPSIGAVVARRWSGEELALPSYVAINGDGGTAGFFGLDFAPYVIGDPAAPFENVGTPEGIDPGRAGRRLAALDAINAGSARTRDPRAIAESARVGVRARRLMTSPALMALDIAKEPESARVAFGAEGEAGGFGRGCLLALRLLEQGVRFVEVKLDGWDTHSDNFNAVAGLSARLDPGLAGLIAGLESRGMLDETLVVCLGEFGRTPTINGDGGRDHWGNAFSAVFAGGGVRGGRAIGATDAKGAEVADRPVTVPDLFATMLSAFGVDPGRSYTTPEGRPIRLADKGKVVAELFA